MISLIYFQKASSMTSTTPKYISSIAIVNDMLHIHEDRINIYKKALHELKDLEGDEKSLLEAMVEQSLEYKQQLSRLAKEDNGEKTELYNVWKAPAVPQSAGDKKTFAKACADDELALANTYALAISMITKDTELEDLLQQQHKESIDLYNRFHEFYNAQ